MQISGLHHITAICGDAQKNIDFYSKLLGLRLVKVTINFDDPNTYHLYYGDEVGRPGSVLTFFAWPNLSAGRAGATQASEISFSVPTGSLRWWESRLAAAKVPFSMHPRSILFVDPDGIQLELNATADDRLGWSGYGIGQENSIKGFESVTLLVERPLASRTLLQKMGFRSVEGDTEGVMEILDGAPGRRVKLVDSAERGIPGLGTIHHVAFSTESDQSQAECSLELTKLGVQPTPVQERQYFRSVYFRESSGILYEIATEGPGFLIDEPVESLAGRLCLPPWYEKFRARIEENLPKIETPFHVEIPPQVRAS